MPPAPRRKDPRTGKGPVKAKAGWRPPSATLPVKPTRQQLQAKSVTTDRPTRSAIRMLPGQPRPAPCAAHPLYLRNHFLFAICFCCAALVMATVA